MTVATKSAYSWTSGKHARLLHAGNQNTISTITATDDTGSTADLVVNGLTRDRWVPFSTPSVAASASLRFDTATPEAAECIAIAAHNLGTTGTSILFEHDSNNNGTWVPIGSLAPADDSPIMFFFNSITSDRWRITLTSDTLPEVGVLRIGVPLVFERPFYSGFTPARMNRATELRGNMSNTGELLGRSKKRTVLSEGYQWQNLTYAWVRANLDGPNGVIQSVEVDSAFMAWRPELTEDVSYIMRAQTGAPAAMGMRDLWSFDMSGEVYSYE